MGTSLRRTLICVLFFGCSSAVPAQSMDHDLVVAGNAEAADAWSSRIGTALTNRVHYPKPLGGADYAQGIVKVKFNCSDTGAAQNVAVIKSSGSNALDRAVVNAVRKFPTLHPLPAGASSKTPFQAWIIFAADEYSAARMERSLKQELQMAKNSPRDGDVEVAQWTIVAGAH